MTVNKKSVRTPSRPSAEKSYRKKQKGHRARWLWISLALTAIAGVSAVGGALLAFSLASVPLRQAKLTPAQASVFSKEETISYKNLNIPQLSRPVNILVLGTKVLTSDVQSKPKENERYFSLVNSVSGLSDTMMLVRLDPIQNKLSVLSIPRDTQAEIRDHGLRKINEANALGGPSLAAESTIHLLGDVPIDRYIRVNVQAVEKLVDALGGVTVYVPKDMKYQDDSQHLYIDLKEGQQHLDGNKTLQLLRFRKDSLGDIGRIQRQQMLTRALVEQALKPQTLLKIPDILSILQAYIDTNLTTEELFAIAGLAAQTKRNDVQMLMLLGDFSSNGRREISYWLPNQRKIQTLMSQYFGHATESSSLDEEELWSESTSPDPMKIRIAIQDGCDNPEAVQALVRHLNKLGYGRVMVASNW
ncbi:MAG: LCP family protein, partial [Snowella sp.]